MLWRRVARALRSGLARVFEVEIAAWRGEARLSRVFWIHGVAASLGLAALYAASLHLRRPLMEQLVLIAFGLYTIWSLVAIWRCSANGHPYWGALARWLTFAWAANVALVLSFRQLELIGRYLGS